MKTSQGEYAAQSDHVTVRFATAKKQTQT